MGEIPLQELAFCGHESVSDDRAYGCEQCLRGNFGGYRGRPSSNWNYSGGALNGGVGNAKWRTG